MEKWKIQDAVETYGVRNWGKGYFAHQQGRPRHRPPEQAARPVHRPQGAGRSTAGARHPAADPAALHRHPPPPRRRDARRLPAAIKESDYQGDYCCVYPIKVNQQRHVVEEILDFGKPFHFGLEAGSKPELLAVLALTNGRDTPIICNGFKDDEFIKMAMLARKIGKQIIPVVEKFTELEAIVRYAEELKVRPVIGVRVKLAARGAGRWRCQRRLPLQVRPDADRGAGGVRVPQAARHGGLPPAGPLPPGQPDHQHPQHQERA